MKVYSGYFLEDRKLLESASGGVCTALSERIIEQGGFVFGVRYTDDFRNAEYCCVDTKAELEQLKGSKYIVSRKNNVYVQLAQLLNDHKIVLFIGLGCDIAGIKKYCSNHNVDTETLYTIDILCHGPAIDGVHERFIDELENHYSSKIKAYNIRYKKRGWTPFYIRAEFENGAIHEEPFNESDFGKAFYRIPRSGCTKCPFKGDNHKGDLCVGDYWGMDQNDPGWNKNGVSIMIIQNPRGEELLSLLGDEFYKKEASVENVLKGNPMYTKSRQENHTADKFINDMKEYGLHYAVSMFPQKKLSLKERLYRMLKK